MNTKKHTQICTVIMDSVGRFSAKKKDGKVPQFPAKRFKVGDKVRITIELVKSA